MRSSRYFDGNLHQDPAYFYVIWYFCQFFDAYDLGSMKNVQPAATPSESGGRTTIEVPEEQAARTAPWRPMRNHGACDFGRGARVQFF